MKLIIAIIGLVIAVVYFYATTKIFVSPFADPAGYRIELSEGDFRTPQDDG